MNKNSKRYKEHAAKRGGGGYIALPHAVIRSQEFAELSAFAVKLLMDMLSQYRGDNNGDLAAYWSKMSRERGWKSKETLFKAIAELRNAGWLELTRLGTRTKIPSLYAVSFYSIDHCDGKLEVKATGSPSRAWHRPAKVEPLVHREAPLAPDMATAPTPKAVPVTYKKNSRVRQAYLTIENRSGSRTYGPPPPENRYASRTYSGDSGTPSGTPAVPLSRITTTQAAPAAVALAAGVESMGGEAGRRALVEVGARPNGEGVELGQPAAPTPSVFERGAVPEGAGGAALVGDLAGRWDELSGRALDLIREHGHPDSEAKRFLGQVKRRHGEVIVLTAIDDYLGLRPRHDETDEPIDAKEWIYWRVRELVGKPVPGVRRLVPGPGAVDEALAQSKEPAAPLHEARPTVSKARTLPDPFFAELLARLARGAHYRPNCLLWDRINRFGWWDQVKQAGLECKVKGLFGNAAQRFLKTYPFEVCNDATADRAGEPASPEAEMQRIREKAASLPRRHATNDRNQHVEKPYWAFAKALLAHDSGKDEKWAGLYLGRKVSKSHWLIVERAVRDCEAKLLWGLRAIEYIETYFLAQEEELVDGAGGQVRAEVRSRRPARALAGRRCSACGP